MQLGIAGFIIFITSLYVFVLEYLDIPALSLQKGLIPLVLLFFCLMYFFIKTSWKPLKIVQMQWFLFFLGSLFIQLLVIGTGGLVSPFFILIHLATILFSFLISASVSFIFLFASFMLMTANVGLHTDLLTFLLKDNFGIILELISLIFLIPIIYLVSRQYHLKDLLITMLNTKLQTDETILEKLNELIIVTDAQYQILSVNEAVEQILQRSRSEILNEPFFTTLLLRDSNGRLVTKDTFSDQNNEDLFTLVNSPLQQKTFTIKLQPIKDVQNQIKQFSFIFSFSHKTSRLDNLFNTYLANTQAKFEALTESIKSELLEKTLPEIRSEVILLGKIERDIDTIRRIKTLTKAEKDTRVDIAQLCKDTVSFQQDFAKSLRVGLNFTLRNFGREDIAPLTVKNFPVAPDQLTGPFFTIACDIKHMGFLIEKMIDFSILLASSVDNGKVEFVVERKEKEMIELQITTQCPSLQKEELADLFVPYYGKLYAKTGLLIGSGFEGFLIKTIYELLEIPFSINHQEGPKSSLTFTLSLKKNFSTGVSLENKESLEKTN